MISQLHVADTEAMVKDYDERALRMTVLFVSVVCLL